MRKIAIFLALFLVLFPFVVAQGFAVSYPPNLKSLSLNGRYEFSITVVNSMDVSLYVKVEANGSNVIIKAPKGVFVSGKNTEKITVILEMPTNLTGANFSGYVRLLASPSGSGGKVAGSVTIPIAGRWEGVSTEPVVTTGSGNITTISSNENLSSGNPGSTLQNTTKNTDENDLISTLIQKYSSENAENVGINTSSVYYDNGSNTTVYVKNVVHPSPTPAKMGPIIPDNNGPNILVYFIGAVIVGLVLSKLMRGEKNDEGPSEGLNYYGDGEYY